MGYQPFGEKIGAEPVRRTPKRVMATGMLPTGLGTVRQTFEEFCEDQRIRLANSLRPPVPEKPVDERFSESMSEHPRARLNDHFTGVTLHRDAEVETRGRC